MVDDRIVVQHRAGHRFATAQDRQPAERLVRGEEGASHADSVMHLDDGAHPLDFVRLVEDPGIAQPKEQHVEAQVLAHALVFRLARARDVGELLGQLHGPDPGDVSSRRAATRVAALDDDDVMDPASGELSSEGEAGDPGTDDHDRGRSRRIAGLQDGAAARPAHRVASPATVASSDETKSPR